MTDKAGILKTREYLTYIQTEARKRYDAGMSMQEAVQDIALGEFEDWGGSERIVDNLNRLYAEFSGTAPIAEMSVLMSMMAPYAERARKRRGARAPDNAPRTCCPH